jgi:hypothetical protein
MVVATARQAAASGAAQRRKAWKEPLFGGEQGFLDTGESWAVGFIMGKRVDGEACDMSDAVTFEAACCYISAPPMLQAKDSPRRHRPDLNRTLAESI